MSVATAPIEIAGLIETEPPPSPAGPVQDDRTIRMPPGRPQRRLTQSLRFVASPLRSNLAARRDFGDVWQLRLLSRQEPFIVTCHPEHVHSLFKAAPADAPSLTGESPLRPILGPNSVLTSVGARHMRQRKLLLPPFHGEAVQRYVEMIARIAEQEIDRWPVGKPFALAPRMQAVTLDVIMGGVFGIVGALPRGSAEQRLRDGVRRMLAASTKPLYQLIELQNAGRKEPRGILRAALALVDRQVYAVIRRRRAQPAESGRHDVLSLLLQARDEEGRELTDQELRDELMSLVLAGHETTANSLAWTFERLLRKPEPYDRLRELVRKDDPAAAGYVEATIHEGMRIRPVIPMIVRMVKRRWQFGDYVVPAGTAVAVSIVALHHREDVYPDPFAFRPERFVDRKPGTYTWIPFGGGIRRCLGATLAMAEQRVVLRAIAERTDLVAPSAAPEKPRQRNVTMIPARGGRVVVERKLAA
ncbi:MAG TPA: cytochrome P450 [Candidatus Dormibacteraeota bacterium]|nr:cytochrome P450 [Candidatus Dormibacteraeota bacterium]